ncbi:MAG: hypothetical protein NUV86_04705 [Candidatus Scalindua sp.]|nr:hypothetical protein [Candidatus Scalindua sp.]MCR4345021.1 hypothetical protein [Candidatus Scalindua sp.]
MDKEYGITPEIKVLVQNLYYEVQDEKLLEFWFGDFLTVEVNKEL